MHDAARAAAIRITDWPEPQQLHMPYLDTTVSVYEGEITVLVPVTATSALIRLGHGLDYTSATITMACNYQACDENSCALPATVQGTLVVSLEPLIEPDGFKAHASCVAPDQAAKRSGVKRYE